MMDRKTLQRLVALQCYLLLPGDSRGLIQNIRDVETTDLEFRDDCTYVSYCQLNTMVPGIYTWFVEPFSGMMNNLGVFLSYYQYDIINQMPVF